MPQAPPAHGSAAPPPAPRPLCSAGGLGRDRERPPRRRGRGPGAAVLPATRPPLRRGPAGVQGARSGHGEEDGRRAERLAITRLAPPRRVTRRDTVTPQPHSQACARAWGPAAASPCPPSRCTGSPRPASQAQRQGRPLPCSACAACPRRDSVPAVGHSPTPEPGAGDPLRPRDRGRGPHRGGRKANRVPAAGPPRDPSASLRGRSTCHPGWNSPPGPSGPWAGTGTQ